MRFLTQRTHRCGVELFSPRHVGPAGVALAGHLGVVAAVLPDVVGGGEVGVVFVAGGGGTGTLGENGITVSFGAHAQRIPRCGQVAND